MSDVKHTQGPWRLILADNVIEAPGGGRLIDITPRSLCCTTEERDANARLIAAAPELLEAIRALVEHLDGFDLNFCFLENNETNHLITAARAVITKASGGNP